MSVALAEDQVALGASAQDGGARYLYVVQTEAQMLADPSANAQKATVLKRGTVLSNLGCATHDTGFWCEGAVLNGTLRGFIEASQVEPAPGVDGTVPIGPDNSRARARSKDFDETGRIKCAQNEGESLGDCRIQVARAGGGDTTAIVTFGNSFTRELFFQRGGFLRANATMSGVGKDIDWTMRGEIYVLRVDDQKFEVPSAYILGN